jgi:hypothetical protein
MNSFGNLLPRYAGGTSEANQPTFQFLQDDGEQEDTVIGTPEGIGYEPDSEIQQVDGDMLP